MNALVISQKEVKLDESVLDQIIKVSNVGRKGQIQRKDETIAEHYIINTQFYVHAISPEHERIQQYLQAARAQGNQYLIVNLNEQDSTYKETETNEIERS